MTTLHQEITRQETKRVSEGVHNFNRYAEAPTRDDLCSSCTRNTPCENWRAGFQVHYCRSYSAPAGMESPKYFPPTIASQDRATGKTLGLCSMCTHRETCTWAMSDGGVWRCSEHETLWP